MNDFHNEPSATAHLIDKHVSLSVITPVIVPFVRFGFDTKFRSIQITSLTDLIALFGNYAS